MLGEKISAIDDTVIDLVGEITNMTCGGAKSLLALKGYDFDMATPVVITGENHKITHKNNGPLIVLPLDVGFGNLYVEMCFEALK